MIPDTELLRGADLVRARFAVESPFGLFAELTAKQIAGQVVNGAATHTHGIPLPPPEIEGGTFVLDFRIKTGAALTAAAFTAELDRVAGGGLIAKTRVQELARLRPAELSPTTAPTERQREAVEGEQSRRADVFTFGELFAKLKDAAALIRALAVAVLIGAILWVTFPFLARGRAALQRLQARRRRAEG